MIAPVLFCVTCSSHFRECECVDAINVWTEATGTVLVRFVGSEGGDRLVSLLHELTPEKARELAAKLLEIATDAQ